MTKTFLAASGVGLMLALLATPVQAAPLPVGCRVAPPDVSRLSAALTEDGLPEYKAWIGDDRGRFFNQSVRQTADRLLRRPMGKESTADRLRRGLIGMAVDDNTQTVPTTT